MASIAALAVLPALVHAQPARDAFMQRAEQIVGPEYVALLATNCRVRPAEWYDRVAVMVERSYAANAREAGMSAQEATEMRVAIDRRLGPVAVANDRTCRLLFVDDTLAELDRLVALNRPR